MKKQIQVICVAGPTASGKTALGVELALRLNGEIISADSMQLYRGIHIASAAPDEAEKRGVVHYMTEFLSPGDSFTVADYTAQARSLIEDISVRGKTPLIVGGTGLYISTLADNITFIKEQTDPALRAELEWEFDFVGADEMLRRLSEFDPESAAVLHPNNRRRILRAFEVYRSTGITFSEANKLSKSGENPYDFIMIGLTFRDREKLYDRINRRVDSMLENGLLDEARSTYGTLSANGAGQAIGHKELYRCLEGEIPLQDAVENLKHATRRYAKRQLTWFRRDERIHWIYVDETDDIAGRAMQIITERKMV